MSLYAIPSNYEFLNIEEPFSWHEVLRDYVLYQVQSETSKKGKTIYYYYYSEGIIYSWDYDEGVLMSIDCEGNKTHMNITQNLAKQAFYKVKQLY